MRTKLFTAACFVVCVAVAPLLAQTADAISGTWVGDWGPTPTHRNDITVQLKWDGKALTGMVNPGAEAIPLQKTSFNPATGVVHLEADADAHGTKVHYVIGGKVDKSTMSGSWNHDNRKGDFKKK